MSGLFDQVVNYSPPLLTAGQVNYKGTWNAATNTPGLVNPPDALSKGDYYVVSADGTQFSISFAVGDWIISNGTAWEKVDLTDAVSSVFGRTGAVVGVSTDYSAVGLTNTAIGAANPSSGAFTSLSSSSTTTLNGTTIPASKTLVVTTDKLSALAATTSAELAGVISDETGSGSLVFANSPTLVTPALGTPSALVGTNITGTASGLTAGNVTTNANLTGAITSVGNATSLGSFTSANLAAAVSDETGSGALVFASSPTLVTPTLGAATATSLNGVTLTGTSTPALSVTGTASVSGSNTGDQTTITGNAGTATILQTARNINGVSFNGSADITVTAAAGTLTGATLASGVTASSLTSLGTITSLTATALTVNDNTTLGSSNSDTVNFNARVASDLNPSTDNTYDLGVTGHEWRNLNIDGTANIDSLVADTADINGGTIDGTAIGATTPSTVAAMSISSTGAANFATSTGDVGIGTASPTQRLQVSSSAGSTYTLITNTGTGPSNLFLGAGNGVTQIISRDATTGAVPISIILGTTEIGRISSTGLNSTAIGATTPSTGAFTTLSATGNISVLKSTPKLTLTSSEDADYNTTIENVYTNTAALLIKLRGNTVLSAGGIDGTKIFAPGVGVIGTFTSTGVAVTGALSSTGGLSTTGNNTFTEPTLGTTSAYLGMSTTGAYFGTAAAKPVYFETSGTERARIDSSGNVGIGTTYIPSASGVCKIVVGSPGASSYSTYANPASSTNIAFINTVNNSSDSFLTMLDIGGLTGQTDASNGGSAIRFLTQPRVSPFAAIERVRIDSSGNLLVGTTSAFDASYRGIQATNSSGGDCAVFKTTGVSGSLVRWNSATSGDNDFIGFFTETSITQRGGISYNRAGGLVAYNVTSDYRAKDIFGAVVDSGAIIDSVPVYMGKMKDATLERPMFIAHETPAYAHTGEKDAVDAEGKPVYQQMDASTLVPVLWAELQSVRARLAALESK
jgi:hypothetical protein